MGHLIPMAALAEQLHRHHHISSTILVPSNGAPPPAQLRVLESLPQGIDYIFLPAVSIGQVDPETRIFSTIKKSLPFIGEALSSLIANRGVDAFLADPFGTDAFHVALQLKVSPYLFFPSSAMTLSFCLYLPKLDEMNSGEYKDMIEPVKIPGCIPIQGSDLLTIVQDRASDVYKAFMHQVKQFNIAEGILLNSFAELEKGAIQALQEKNTIYPIGPRIQTGSTNGSDRSECLKWLNEQPTGSVIFISFGSGGTLSSNQLTELALGLEKSGQRFLWVVKTPNDVSANADFFGNSGKEDPLSYLPSGFLDRTKEKGLMVPNWAPQVEILSHVSTGGFLTHCGWNSTLESVTNGVPLIAWPLYAEQKMNAVMLSNDLKVSLRPETDEDGLVGRDEIANVVLELMEGDEGIKIRVRMNKLKIAADEVLKEDGSSSKSLSEFALKLNKSESG
jgi:hydroquinone glucosyltransferase